MPGIFGFTKIGVLKNSKLEKIQRNENQRAFCSG